MLAALAVERAEEAARNSRQARLRADRESEKLLAAWIDELTSVRVLDPACGSGNFLYVALRRMLDLWLEARCFLGIMKGGPFDISDADARLMLSRPFNPNGKPNSDVVKRRSGGRDITSRDSCGWLIDFGEMSLHSASLYEWPFEFVKKHVKPLWDINRDVQMRTKWWLHGRSRPALREAISGLSRCIVTPEVAKHRVFVWMDTATVPDHT